MILDAFLLFSQGQDLFTPGAGNIDSTNIIDLGVGFANPGNLTGEAIPSNANGGGARDIGTGDNPSLELLIQAATAFAGGTSLVCSLQGAPDNGSGAPGAFTPMWTSPTVLTANLDQGQQIGNVTVPLPVPGQPMPRFLKMVYTTVGDFTTGTVTAGIVLDRFDQPRGTDGQLSGYRAGINVAN
jgi:hypothetical protein